jgi:hypothetical protein
MPSAWGRASPAEIARAIHGALSLGDGLVQAMIRRCVFSDDTAELLGAVLEGVGAATTPAPTLCPHHWKTSPSSPGRSSCLCLASEGTERAS